MANDQESSTKAHPSRGKYATRRALATAFILTMAFLAWQGMVLAAAAEKKGISLSVFQMIEDVRFVGTPLLAVVVRYLATQLVLHALLALIVWWIGQLVRLTTPGMVDRPILATALSFAAVILWLLAANATYFPWSMTSGIGAIGRASVSDSLTVFDILTVAMGSGIALMIWKLLKLRPALGRWVPRLVVYSTLIVGGGVVLRFVGQHARADESSSSSVRPNVLLIGIDSLRPDVLNQGAVGATPNVDAFLRESFEFSDAITPLARTYPAWTSMLFGRYPKHTGARENLIPRARLVEARTLPEVLRKVGYHSIYATDEVRFANIDQEFGFDTVIAPAMGVSDFLLGAMSDLPLTNLLVNVRAGKYLFPGLYANRAVAQSYEPETFVERLSAELPAYGPETPAFMSIHLTLPHWPYRWAGANDEAYSRVTEQPYTYLASVIEADKQFGEILELLETRGYLNNAIVFVLSDHGEGLGLPDTDTLLRSKEAKKIVGPLKVDLWGHGNSVLSLHQFHVLLAARGFGPQESRIGIGQSAAPVTLVDLAPTVLEAVGVLPESHLDGDSLLPILQRNSQAEQAFLSRPRFTETGITATLTPAGDVDEVATVRSAADFYRMNNENGRLEVREERLKNLLADKERAVMIGPLILAAVPPSNSFGPRFIAMDMRGGLPTLLVRPPTEDRDAEWLPLWAAMHDHYGDELPSLDTQDHKLDTTHRQSSADAELRDAKSAMPRGTVIN